MDIPKLKMCKADVETAIARTFREKFSALCFVRDQKFLKIDRDYSPAFTLQKDFDGVGVYSVRGNAKLFSEDGCTSHIYTLSFNVKIENNNDSPKVCFIDVISIIKNK
jgi:hypothetical protein